MSQRERQRPERIHEPEATAPAAGAGGSAIAAERAQRLLAVAEDAIARALSQDPAQFLADHEQAGGQ